MKQRILAVAVAATFLPFAPLAFAQSVTTEAEFDSALTGASSTSPTTIDISNNIAFTETSFQQNPSSNSKVIDADLVTVSGNGHTISGSLPFSLLYVDSANNPNATLSLSNLTLTNASAIGNGAAVSSSDDFKGKISQVVFTQNSSRANGGALGVNGTLSGSISNSTFSNNSVTLTSAAGGAIYAGAITGSITNTTFTSNTTMGAGGAIWTRNINSDLSGSSFQNNQASNGNGGAIYVDEGGSITALQGDLSFSGNTDLAGTPNAIFIENSGGNGSFSLGAGKGHKIEFDDPISSDSNHPLQEFDLNPTSDETGEIVFNGAQSNLYFDNAVASYGTMTLANGAAFGANDNAGNFTLASGATLNVAPGARTTPVAIDASGNIKLYGTLNFEMPDGISNGDTLMTVSGDTDVTKANVVIALPATVNLKKGDFVTLINASNAGKTVTGNVSNGVLKVGTLTAYTFNINEDASKNLVADLSDVTDNSGNSGSQTGGGNQNNGGGTPNFGNMNESNARLVSTSYLADIATLTRGSDLVSDKGIERALEAAQNADGWRSFAVFSGGHDRYNAGDHLNSNGFNLMAGAAIQHALGQHAGTLGAFVEYGHSNVDAYASKHVKASGNAHFIGGGLLGRVDFAGSDKGHFFLEGAARGGKVKSETDSDDFIQYNGSAFHNFRDGGDVSAPYYGVNVGAGYVWKFSNQSDLNTYAKFQWTHIGSKDVKADSGDRVKFDDVNSELLRVGARFTKPLSYSSPARFYIGAAFEHEFDGKSDVTVNNYGIHNASDLKGSDGMAEVGFLFTKVGGKNVTIDVGAQGRAGDRRGYGGAIRLNWKF